MRHEHILPDDRFRHVALFYSSDEEFLQGTVPFIDEGLAAGEPVLVVETRDKLHLLRVRLGQAAAGVEFADMAEIGANPARIIPAWQEFVARPSARGQALRGIGEPIWAGRHPDELAESQWHESLLNVAFGRGRPWTLLCPYDVAHLDEALIEEARRSHEWVMELGAVQKSLDYRGVEGSGAPFSAPLSAPSQATEDLVFDAGSLRRVRAVVARAALDAGLDSVRVAQLVTAVNEVASNSVRHGGGNGQLRVWPEASKVVCEIRDRGLFDRPLVDRQRPGQDPSASRGLWLANQLCDLVQIRAVHGQTVVRLHMSVRPRRGLTVIPDLPAATV